MTWDWAHVRLFFGVFFTQSWCQVWTPPVLITLMMFLSCSTLPKPKQRDSQSAFSSSTRTLNLKQLNGIQPSFILYLNLLRQDKVRAATKEYFHYQIKLFVCKMSENVPMSYFVRSTVLNPKILSLHHVWCWKASNSHTWEAETTEYLTFLL